jgi:hypothetical protein
MYRVVLHTGYRPNAKDHGPLLYHFDALFKAMETESQDVVDNFILPRLNKLRQNKVIASSTRSYDFLHNFDTQAWMEEFWQARLKACPPQDKLDVSRMVAFVKEQLSRSGT